MDSNKTFVWCVSAVRRAQGVSAETFRDRIWPCRNKPDCDCSTCAECIVPRRELARCKNKTKISKHCHHCKAVQSRFWTVELRLCSRCQKVRYCGRLCQKLSWNTDHRRVCKQCLFYFA